jgi:DNA-binding transcriptional ArsR family regulator
MLSECLCLTGYNFSVYSWHMENKTERLNKVFHALADDTRRKILLRIMDEEYSVTELAEPFDMSLAAVSKHVKVLEKSGLLRRTKSGKIHWCGINVEPLGEAQTLLDTFRK